MANTSPPQLHIAPTPDEVLSQLADFIVALATSRLATQDRFTVALSGGSSPKKLYTLLASPAYRTRVRWEQVVFFFGDERYVPPTDAESNYRLAHDTLLGPLGIAPAQVVAVDTSLPPAAAAQDYSRQIAQFFGAAPPRLDLVLLGLGEDAHTASLFPGTSVLQATAAGAEAVFLEAKQVYRITLTAPLLNQADTVAFLVYGPEKAAAVQQVLAQPKGVAPLPAQLIAPASGRLHWFLDEAAAARLPAGGR